LGAPEAPAWDAVLLVCRECRKRGNGPREPKPKQLVQALKHSVREQRPRPRVLLTSCLGLCPKRATAVSRVGGSHGRAVIGAVTSLAEIDGLARW
jgi:predicted metal-binding protein